PHPAIVAYHLELAGPGAADRLTLVTTDDAGVVPLTDKLLRHRSALDRVADAAGKRDDAYLLPFNVTALELEAARRLGLPLFAARPEHVPLGSKTGSRRVARQAGVDVPQGAEDLWSIDALQREALALLG